MTAITGETGAGKTLVVEALDMLLGGRADPVLVRPGSEEAFIEGRFLIQDDEVLLARSVPRSGRSRAWVDGRMAPVALLAETGASLVEIHGQHAHRALVDAGAQRHALDEFASADPEPMRAIRRGLRAIEADLEGLGGDARERARETDLLRYQLAEIERARLESPDEDAELDAEEELLAGAAASRVAAEEALALLATGDRNASDTVGSASRLLAGRSAFAAVSGRLESLQAELDDLTTALRVTSEDLLEDPEKLEAVRARRQLLRDLRRKYGETLTDVLAFAESTRQRLLELGSFEARALDLETERAELQGRLAREASSLASLRKRAAPQLAEAVEARLSALALPSARFEVLVEGPDPADAVSFLLGANPGEPLLPLSKAASGGELARVMLALRLVLTGSPPTMVFDEVDAGIGGAVAAAVGSSLAEVAQDRQVLVVTHLAQVAACADNQVTIRKELREGRTAAAAEPLTGSERVMEIARMLSGRPGSASAMRHAEELLDSSISAVRHDAAGVV